MDTFYWHDYETWGINPAEDKPSQFAGVRTDYDFNVIGEPLNIMCQPTLDTLPSLDACLITGITPQQAEANGVVERDFFAAIHSQLAQPGTCSVGYNSLRFDDEVTRYGFYRNFYDPYAREWQSGNSRWDVIDMLRLCYAVRPDGMEWPLRDDGIVSFRLEQLTQANGLSHEAAHDALSDVYATIAVAKMVKQKQPRLYQHVFSLRNKKVAQQALGVGSGKPVLHISSKFGSEFACGSLVLPITEHPVNKNEIICIDLRYSPAPLFDLSANQLAELLYTKVSDLPEGIERIPIKTIHINRCPIILSPGLVDVAVSERMQLDLALCEQHRQLVLAEPMLAAKLQQVVVATNYDNSGRDAEALLYDGFISNNDKQLIKNIPNTPAEMLAESVFLFEDNRLPDLLFRYRARNFPDSLNESEREEWLDFCRTKLTLGDRPRLLSAIEEIQAQLGESDEDTVLRELLVYCEAKVEMLNQ